MKRIIKFPLYLLLVVMVLVLAVVYVYYFTTLPETEINAWLKGFSEKKLGVIISFEKVNRDTWNSLTLEGVKILPSKESQHPIAQISKLDLSYSLLDIIRGNYHFKDLKIDSLNAHIPEDGFSFLPSAKGGEGKPSTLILSFNKILVERANITLKNGDLILFDSLESTMQLNKGKLDFKIDHLAGAWPSRDIYLNSMASRISSDSSGYQVDSLSLYAGETHLLVSGHVGKSFTNNWDLRFAATPIDFNDISKTFHVHVPGVVFVDGTLRGSLDTMWGHALLNGSFLSKRFENLNCQYAFSNKVLQFTSVKGSAVGAAVNGSLMVDFGVRPEAYSFTGTIKHLDLREIGPALKTDFNGGVHLRGVGFNEKSFAMSLDGDLDSVRIENYYFDQVSGPVSFDLKTLNFLPGFQARYKDTYLTGTGYLEYSGDLDITGDVDFQDLTNFTGQTFIKELGGRGKSHLHVTGPTLDFNVQATFESDSAWTYGLFPAQLNIETNLETFITHPVGQVTASWKGGTFYSLATDSGYFNAGVSGTRVFIDTASAVGPLGSIALVGQYNGTTVPPIFYADTLYGIAGKNVFFSREPLVLNMRPEETEFKRFILGLGSGIIQATGAVTTDLKLNVDVLATGFEIKPIVSQFYNDKRLSGIWWGQAKLRGDFTNPRIDFDLQIDSLAVNDTLLGDLDAQLTYRDEYLHTDSTHLASDYGEYYFSGDIPIDLSFGEVKTRFPEKPIDLRMTASGNRLSLAEVFIPSVERFVTNFAIGMRLGGTYSKPTISGSGTLSNGTLKILDLVNPLTDVNAHLRMENETIYIDSLVATVHGGQDWVQPLGEILSVRRNAKPVQMVRA
ncbi:MAG TPA: hypothetical protein DCZ43_05230, partial [candidate division Zixibacteria bacterium]|nr:hypothetical protein [candidate division Zixibacteria bacterium]